MRSYQNELAQVRSVALQEAERPLREYDPEPEGDVGGILLDQLHGPVRDPTLCEQTEQQPGGTAARDYGTHRAAFQSSPGRGCVGCILSTGAVV
jgi:hypothetical protein